MILVLVAVIVIPIKFWLLLLMHVLVELGSPELRDLVNRPHRATRTLQDFGATNCIEQSLRVTCESRSVNALALKIYALGDLLRPAGTN